LIELIEIGNRFNAIAISIRAECFSR